MEKLDLALTLVWVHIFADFFLQSDKMAINKSSSNKWLTIHICVYSLPFFYWGWKYALINAALHWCTDWVTSRMTTILWKKEMRHWFFVVIGIDQGIHITCLIKTMRFMW